MEQNKLELLHEQQQKVFALYNADIRDAIIFIESEYHKFPVPFLNEIRAAQDHMARCFAYPQENEDWEVFVTGQMNKAMGHYNRCLLDAYKYIWYRYGRKLYWSLLIPKCFGKLRDIDNGEFYQEYLRLRKEAKDNNNKARKIETTDKERAKDLFRDAIGNLKQIEDLFETNYGKIGWSVAKGFVWRVIWATGWIISAIYFFFRNYDPIMSFINRVF